MICITNHERYLAKILFKNRIYQYKGQQFEDFFVNIMCKKDPNFQPVKAYGNIGDKKNDGFNKTTGTYYQVYAPEDATKNITIADMVNKLEKDFEGLYAYWNSICKIKNYFFVVNDKYAGVAATVNKKIIELSNRTEYSDVSIELLTSKDLERIFNELDDASILDVVGFLPSEELPIIEFEALNETVSYLLNVELPDKYDETLFVPDFEKKIEFNNLSEVVCNQLITGSYQEGILRQYFNDSPGVNELLQKRFHYFYEQSKIDIPDVQENYADLRFYYILDCACTKRNLAITTCVVVLMAYYFSSCDIFEEPK